MHEPIRFTTARLLLATAAVAVWFGFSAGHNSVFAWASRTFGGSSQLVLTILMAIVFGLPSAVVCMFAGRARLGLVCWLATSGAIFGYWAMSFWE